MTTHHHGINKKTCASSDDMLRAIQFGSRRWDDLGLTSLQKELHQSYFVPDQCNVPAMTSFEMCQTLSRFQHVVSIGDSLLRHLHQGLFIGLRHDYVSGGIQTSNKRTYKECKCDGQFSEHSVCRKNDGLFTKFENSHQLEICSQQKPFFMAYKSTQLARRNMVDYDIPWNEIDCNSSDYRGLLLVLGGGVHSGCKATETINVIKDIFEHERLQECVDKGKAHVVWTHFGAQSRSLDLKFPHQAREKAIVFNQNMSNYFASIKMNVIELHFWNMTKDAQSSDGLHYMLDVNVFKAFFLLRVAHLLKEEGGGII